MARSPLASGKTIRLWPKRSSNRADVSGKVMCGAEGLRLAVGLDAVEAPVPGVRAFPERRSDVVARGLRARRGVAHERDLLLPLQQGRGDDEHYRAVVRGAFHAGSLAGKWVREVKMLCRPSRASLHPGYICK